MTKRKSNKNLWIIMIAFLIAGCLADVWDNGCIVRAQAADQEMTEVQIMEELNSHRDSIVRVESICWDGEDEIYQKKAFSGFVVSKDTSGVYVVTIHNNLTYSSEEKTAIEEACKEKLLEEAKAKQAEEQAKQEEELAQQQAAEKKKKKKKKKKQEETAEEETTETEPTPTITEYQIDNNVRIAEKLEVVFNGDLRVKASILGESEQRNLTVLKLEQSISFNSILQFPEDSTTHKNNIYLLGYPMPEDGAETVCNSENVRITEGTRLGEFQQDEIAFFTHNIAADQGCIGGPLLYEDGQIAGVLLNGDGEAQGTAITSESLKAFLATFQVPYEENKTVVEEKKLPILNIVLGILIAVLVILVITRAVKGKDKARGSKKKKGSKKNYSSPASHVYNPGVPDYSDVQINASVEYSAEKRIVLIRKARFVIGRTNECDFILSENKGISRQHACITYQNREFYISDLGSTNHTFLNGSELMPGEKRLLKNGDEIMVGKEMIIFYRS